MKTYTIQIKNMVCTRCIHVVKQILTDLGITYSEVDLGYAILNDGQSLDLETVNQRLEALDLGLVRNSNEVLVTEINKLMHEYLDNINLLSQKLNLSEFLSQKLARNYHQLSKIYSQYSGETIEQHFIELRTNMVKELIKQGKLNLSQIAVNVGYSGIHYLSGQFKKFTGKSLTQYKKEWEASLGKTRSKEKEPSPKILGKNTGCGCGCVACDCDENKNVSSKDIPRKDRFGRNEGYGLSMLPSHRLSVNFGEYSVHVSA